MGVTIKKFSKIFQFYINMFGFSKLIVIKIEFVNKMIYIK